MSGLEDLTEWLDAMPRWLDAMPRWTPGDGAQYEIETLIAIRDWAIGQQPVSEGDHVRIVHDLCTDETSGWWPWSEALAAGRTGIIAEPIRFNAYRREWRAPLRLDSEWTRSDLGRSTPHPGSSIFHVPVNALARVAS